MKTVTRSLKKSRFFIIIVRSQEKESVFMYEKDLEINCYNYYFSREDNQCFIEVNGEVSFKQSIQLMDDVVNDQNYSKGMLILVDLSKIIYHPSYDEFLALRNHLKSKKPYIKNRIALVCNLKMRILGHLTSVFMNLAKVDMKTFTDRDSALKWLNEKKHTSIPIL